MAKTSRISLWVIFNHNTWLLRTNLLSCPWLEDSQFLYSLKIVPTLSSILLFPWCWSCLWCKLQWIFHLWPLALFVDCKLWFSFSEQDWFKTKYKIDLKSGAVCWRMNFGKQCYCLKTLRFALCTYVKLITILMYFLYIFNTSYIQFYKSAFVNSV